MQQARIKLSSPNLESLSDICGKILQVAERTGIKHTGSIPLPTKKLTVPVRKSPCGGGTETYEKWQMRIHKRIINLQADDRTLRRIMRVDIPDSVHLEIKLKEK